MLSIYRNGASHKEKLVPHVITVWKDMKEETIDSKVRIRGLNDAIPMHVRLRKHRPK